MIENIVRIIDSKAKAYSNARSGEHWIHQMRYLEIAEKIRAEAQQSQNQEAEERAEVARDSLVDAKNVASEIGDISGVVNNIASEIVLPEIHGITIPLIADGSHNVARIVISAVNNQIGVNYVLNEGRIPTELSDIIDEQLENLTNIFSNGFMNLSYNPEVNGHNTSDLVDITCPNFINAGPSFGKIFANLFPISPFILDFFIASSLIFSSNKYIPILLLTKIINR